MARKSTVLVLTAFFTVLDLVVTTLVFCHGTECHNHFTVNVYGYSFNNSLFDLWVMSPFRTAVLLGAFLAFLCNPTEAVLRISKYKVAVFAIALLMWSVNIIKLMAISEVMEDLKNPWLWAMIGWTAIASVMLAVDWLLLGKIVHRPTRSENLYINCEGEERKPLIAPNGDINHEENKEQASEPKKVPSVSLFRLLSNSSPDWPLIMLGFVFLTISSVGQIFIPFYTGQVIDGIVIDKSQTKFISAIVTMALISLGSAIAAGLRGGCFILAINRLNIRLRNKLFTSIINQEIGFFDTVSTGDITSRLTSDITTMSETLGLNINIFLRSMIKAIGVLVFMVKLSLRLTGVTVVAMPIIVGVSKVYGQYYKELSEAVQDSLAVANDVAEEVCSSMRTVRSFANEPGEAIRYSDKLEETYKLRKKQAVAYAGYVWSNQIFELMLSVGVLYYGGHLVVNDVISGGNLVSFILYQLELGNCIQGMGTVYTGLMEAAGASHKVFEYIDRKPELSCTGQYEPDTLEGQLEFRNVTFSYPSRPHATVLQNLSFIVKPGEVVALVGPSGGGKSSCVNLLEHFYECQSGQILLDGVPIQQYKHKYLHHQLALVGQEPVLYARSVMENISYGLDNATESMVNKAAELANAHRFIVELTDGYKTKSGQKGQQLSGGQKQRIAIARALIRNPTVLLLDEATSALDAESEHIIQNAIYKNLKGRTVIIIAHRLSTVERADRIIVIDKGVILQHGTHKDLLKEDGMYATLVQRQLLGSGTEANYGRGKTHCDKCNCNRATASRSQSNDSLHLPHTSNDNIRDSPLQISFRIGSQ